MTGARQQEKRRRRNFACANGTGGGGAVHCLRADAVANNGLEVGCQAECRDLVGSVRYGG